MASILAITRHIALGADRQRCRWLPSLAVVIACLLIAGCDDVILENPLSTISDDSLVGNWSRVDSGEFALRISRGGGQAYDVLTARDIEQKAPPTRWFLVRVNGRLLVQRTTACDEHRFKISSESIAARANVCWELAAVEIGNDLLRIHSLKASLLVRQSETGLFEGVEHRIGTAVAQSGARSSCVLLQGPSTAIEAALGRYLQLPEAYSRPEASLRRSKSPGLRIPIAKRFTREVGDDNQQPYGSKQ